MRRRAVLWMLLAVMALSSGCTLWREKKVVNNWSDSKDLRTDTRYTVKDVPLMVARASEAFHEYAPMRPFGAEESERVYRQISYGPLLDVFVLDMRN